MSDHLINLLQMIGTWATCVLATIFMVKQNRILSKENEIFQNQKDLNDVLIQDQRIKDCIRKLGVRRSDDIDELDKLSNELASLGITTEEVNHLAHKIFGPNDSSAGKATTRFNESKMRKAAMGAMKDLEKLAPFA